MPTELFDIDPHEVSLVRHPANRRKFILIKNKGGKAMPDLKTKDKDQFEIPEELNPIIAVAVMPLEKEDEKFAVIEKAAKELSAEAKNALKSALRILATYKNEIPNEIFAKLGELLGYGYPPAKKSQEKEETKKGLDINLDELPETMRGAVEKMMKSLEAAQKEQEELKKQLEQERRQLELEKQKTELQKIAKGLNVDIDKAASLMIDIKEKVGEEAYKQMEQLIKSASETIVKSGLLDEKGTSVEPTTNSVWEEIEKKAKERIQKSDGKLTKEQAIAQVLQENPDLYERYEEEMKKTRV